MATLLKVLINLADIKSAGGVALRVGIQAGHKTEKQLRVYLGNDFEQEEYAGELVAFMR